MFVLGHVGLTLAAARRLERDVDARWAAFLALAPDMLDKPLSRLAPELAQRNTRGLGHSLAFSFCVFAALLLWKRKPRTVLVLWGCYAGHLLLDAMWSGVNPRIAFWPLLGAFPPRVMTPFFSWTTVWTVAGELAGLLVLYRLGLFERAKRAAVLRTGRL